MCLRTIDQQRTGQAPRLVPFEKPAWREVLPGALFAAVVFELGKTVFSIYIDTVANFEAVYGSVSSIIMLLLWLYFAAHVNTLWRELMAVRREDGARARDGDRRGEVRLTTSQRACRTREAIDKRNARRPVSADGNEFIWAT